MYPWILSCSFSFSRILIDSLVSRTEAADFLVELPQRDAVAVVLQETLGLREGQPAELPVLIRYGDLEVRRVDAERVLGNDVNLLPPEIAVSEAGHGHRGERVEREERGS